MKVNPVAEPGADRAVELGPRTDQSHMEVEAQPRVVEPEPMVLRPAMPVEEGIECEYRNFSARAVAEGGLGLFHHVGRWIGRSCDRYLIGRHL